MASQLKFSFMYASRTSRTRTAVIRIVWSGLLIMSSTKLSPMPSASASRRPSHTGSEVAPPSLS